MSVSIIKPIKSALTKVEGAVKTGKTIANNAAVQELSNPEVDAESAVRFLKGAVELFALPLMRSDKNLSQNSISSVKENVLSNVSSKLNLASTTKTQAVQKKTLDNSENFTQKSKLANRFVRRS